jgi:hypothetical protein
MLQLFQRIMQSAEALSTYNKWSSTNISGSEHPSTNSSTIFNNSGSGVDNGANNQLLSAFFG